MPQETSPGTPSGDADIIFSGGSIVTVTDEDSVPEAVAVKDGLIAFVGSQVRAEAEWQGPDTQWRDLQGGVLLPGFIDAHGHVIGTGLQATIANLLADPDGDVTSIESLQEKLREFARSEVGQRSEWILGFGYGDSTLAEGRHPTRDDLDAVSTDKPVLAIHQFFHLGAVNSKGLELLDYTTETKDPEGGIIRRRTLARGTASKPPYGDPDGVLEETAFTPASNLAVECSRRPAQLDRHPVQPGHPRCPLLRRRPGRGPARVSPGRGEIHHHQRRPAVLRRGHQGQHRGRQARRLGDSQPQPAQGRSRRHQGHHHHGDIKEGKTVYPSSPRTRTSPTLGRATPAGFIHHC